MKKLIIAVTTVLTLIFTACTTIEPGYGAGTIAVFPDAEMLKTGEASGKFLFGKIPLSSADVSVSTAAKNGGIKKIATVDTKIHSVLGIIVTRTTIVTGQ